MYHPIAILRLVTLPLIGLLFFGCASVPVAEHNGYPAVQLANSAISTTVYLPDATTGYYRGARFDRSGMIAELKWGKHTIFGEWKSTPHDPYHSDDVVGPAEEFGMVKPLGYDQADVGDTFVKIGVGRLLKPEEEKYWFPNTYDLVDAGIWTHTSGPDWTQSVHVVVDPGGYAYRYTKRLELVDGAPEFVIRHRLENTGEKAIETDWYCHNFIVFDGQPLGVANRVRLPIALSEPKIVKETVEFRGSTIQFLQTLPAGKSIWAELHGRWLQNCDVVGTFEQIESDVALHVELDRTPTKVVFYAIGKAMCIEPFIQLHIEPGHAQEWNTRYSLSTSGSVNPAR